MKLLGFASAIALAFLAGWQLRVSSADLTVAALRADAESAFAEFAKAEAECMASK